MVHVFLASLLRKKRETYRISSDEAWLSLVWYVLSTGGSRGLLWVIEHRSKIPQIEHSKCFFLPRKTLSILLDDVSTYSGKLTTCCLTLVSIMWICLKLEMARKFVFNCQSCRVENFYQYNVDACPSNHTVGQWAASILGAGPDILNTLYGECQILPAWIF